MNTKTVFISECERDHIISGLRTRHQVKQNEYSDSDHSQDLFVVLNKIDLLKKNLNNMERSDVMKYECLRKKMKEVRCNAKNLLQSDEISMEEMQKIIRNLNHINRKMKEMSSKLGSKRLETSEPSDSESSDQSAVSIVKKKRKPVSKPEPKKKTQNVSTNVGEKVKRVQYEEVENNPNVVSSKREKQKINKSQNSSREETKSSTHSRLAGIFRDQDCLTQPDQKPKILKGSKVTKYSKSNDHQHHCYNGLVLETCSKCLCKRWSIPSVNRTSLKTYIKKNIKNPGHSVAVNTSGIMDCAHSFCHGRRSKKKDDYVPLPGLVPEERKHLKAVRNKILKENAPKNGSDPLKTNSSTGCCFISNADLDVFETSDRSLNKKHFEVSDDIFDSISTDYKGEAYHFRNKSIAVPMADGSTQCDGERSNSNCKINMMKPVNIREGLGKKEDSALEIGKFQTNEKGLTTKKCTERLDKCVQSANPKVDQCTSYDNFILHPQFSWSMPMIGQVFRRSIPLPKEKWEYLDKDGKFIHPSKPTTNIATDTKKPKHTLVMDKSVQTNDMLFTKNMHQVMYLNVVYTKTHLRYIIPNSMEVPILPQTPKVIERRAIDNGYAVTTYKADPDGVIHFTLAYSDGEECNTDGSRLSLEANRRLSQLKNLWIYSARKFFSQLTEKLVGESGDFEESHWTDSQNSSSDYTSSSITGSQVSDASTRTDDTDCQR